MNKQQASQDDVVQQQIARLRELAGISNEMEGPQEAAIQAVVDGSPSKEQLDFLRFDSRALDAEIDDAEWQLIERLQTLTGSEEEADRIFEEIREEIWG